ncbi:telomere length regulator protein [Aspergillus japonicus CBS 114.51]|uniref:Telomere length regulator protein n=1 Tax=Aspergillus japonicus CBS 114.51 TaxID=1448312 RepID=A0A8T8XBA2_ASPJA|nr:telomere length regulator protein [Aspergillus japonicus CBS 114.51]RAH85496.1 telomere length regulator protein [Aspergillus japonicus CBS 114.51]
MVEILGPVSARPPTPPRTSSFMLSEKDRREDSPAIVHTPRDSPFSVNGSTGAPSTRQSKRVNFSPWTKYIKPPTFTNSTAKPRPELKVLPPSNELKPAKSILKTTSSHSLADSPSSAPPIPDTFTMLLESILQQLAGDTVSSRLDAYMQFFGALRAYEGLPGEQEVIAKLGTITHFIQRDISRDLPTGGPLDTNLVIQALKLAVALVWHNEISARLSDEFKAFLIDHSIDCLQDAKVPKSVITHYLSVLATQNFNTRIMTNARVIRLLTVLNSLTSRVNGNAIVSQRLSIYSRVLGQSKSIFVSHAALWMEHLISGLLHHMKDTRFKAISVGFQTSITCGPNPTLSKTVRDVLGRFIDKGRKMVTEVCERMSRMMNNPESGIHVPQVWGVIVLLLRSKKFNVDQWEHFKEWVLVLQRCFNCSDSSIKAQAILGWNRFVLVVGPSDTTSPSILKMLSKPIMSQFDRKKHDKQPSQLALCSYYNLLYYAFRPSATFEHLDVVWKEYIASPLSNVFATVPGMHDRLAHVLSSMFWSSHPRPWVENKVNESNKLDPEELPSIDSRWLRSRISSVLDVLESIFKAPIWTDNFEQSHVSAAWLNLSRALAFTFNKEITPTPESMQTVAHVLVFLRRIWTTGPDALGAKQEDDSMDTFFERFGFLSTTMIQSLGSARFTEKLVLRTSDYSFQAATTPTHRHSRATANLSTPTLHYLRIISEMSVITVPSMAYSHMVKSVLEATCSDKVSRSSRLELLQQCSSLYDEYSDSDFPLGPFLAQTVWECTAQSAADSLRSLPMETARERDGSVTRDYENVVKILSTGLNYYRNFQIWNELLNSLIRVVRTERSDQAITLMIIEPLAESIMKGGSRKSYLPLASILKHLLSITYYQQFERENNESHLPFHKLVDLVGRTLLGSYEHFNPSETSDMADFIESLTSLLGSGTSTVRSIMLESLQLPLAIYLKDEDKRLSVESGVESRILTACRALSSAVLNILQASSPHNAPFLQKFEDIIYAGLDSSHISVRRRFYDFWNSTFGSQRFLSRPERITLALESLEALIKHQQATTPLEESKPGAPMSTSDEQETKNRFLDMSAKSRISFILDNPVDSGLNSSPVTGGSDRAVTRERAKELHRERAFEADNQSVEQHVAVSHPDPFISGPEDGSKRSELFSMIESLRSSSPPSNTPRDIHFMTPPHLRHLHHSDTDAGTPQTPPLPPVSAENEYNYLGSSPTPVSRGRAQLSDSHVPPPPTSAPEASLLETEPRSSPPELTSLSADLHSLTPGSYPSNETPVDLETPTTTPGKSKKAKKKAKRSAKLKKKSKSELNQTEHVTQDAPSEVADQPMTKRLRSSTGKTSDSPLQSTTEKQHTETATESNKETRHTLSTRASASANAVDSKTGPEVEKDLPQNVEVIESQVEQPSGDSGLCNDDVDMEDQVSSQLEQDLELAVDKDDVAGGEASMEASHEPQPSRKRKREMEEHTPQKKERRRSSRLTKTPAAAEDEADVAQLNEILPTPQDLESSPVESAPKRRKHDTRSEAISTTRSAANSQTSEPVSLKDKPSESQDKSQKRRSSRLSGQAAPPIPEESPIQKKSKKSPRPSRPRKQDKDKDTETIQEESDSQETTADDGPREPAHENASDYLDDVQKASDATVVPEVDPETREPEESVQPALEAQEEVASTIQPAPADNLQPSADNDIQMTDAHPTAETAPEPQKTPSSSRERHSEKKKKKTRASSRAATAQAETEAPTEPVPVKSEAEIANSLRKVLDDVKLAKLDRQSLKEIDDLLFDIRVETHEAMRRNTG